MSNEKTADHSLTTMPKTKLSSKSKISISLAEFKRLKEIETLYNEIKEKGEPMICGNGSTKGCGEICYKSDQPKDWDGWRAFCKDCYKSEEEEQWVYDVNGKPVQTIKSFKKEFAELLEEEEEQEMVHCVGCNEPVCKFTEEPVFKDERDEALCEGCYDPCKTCIVCVDMFDYNNTGKMCLIHDPRDLRGEKEQEEESYWEVEVDDEYQDPHFRYKNDAISWIKHKFQKEIKDEYSVIYLIYNDMSTIDEDYIKNDGEEFDVDEYPDEEFPIKKPKEEDIINESPLCW